MNPNRRNALRTSTLAHFSCQLARHFLDLRELGEPSLMRLAADLQITDQEHDRIQEEAGADYYIWAIANVPTRPLRYLGSEFGGQA